MAARKAILFEHDTLMIRPEQDQLLENLVHMVNSFKYFKYIGYFFVLLKDIFLFRLLSNKTHWVYLNFVQLKMYPKLIEKFY